MAWHALEEDRSTSDAESQKSKWIAIRSYRRFVVVALLSYVMSILWLFRIEGGWSIEPLTWLSLVWAIVFLVLFDFVELRWKLRLSTIAIVLALLGAIIMFPFSGIQMTHWRSEFRRLNHDEIDDRGRQQEAEQVKRHPWQMLWHWRRLPDRRLIPYCLAWRASLGGIEMIEQSSVTELSKKRWPRTFLQTDLKQLDLSAEEYAALRPESKEIFEDNLRWMDSLGILHMTNRPAGRRKSIRESSRDPNRDFVETVLQQIESFDELHEIEIDELTIAMSQLNQILSLPQLVSLQLRSMDLIEDGPLVLVEPRTITGLRIQSVVFADDETLLNLLRTCPQLKFLEMDYEVLTSDFIATFGSLNDLQRLAFNANDQVIDLNILSSLCEKQRLKSHGLEIVVYAGKIEDLPRVSFEPISIFLDYPQFSSKALREIFFEPQVEVDRLEGQITTKKTSWPELLEQLGDPLTDTEREQLKEWFGEKSLRINRRWDSRSEPAWGYSHHDEYAKLEFEVRQSLLRWMDSRGFQNGKERVDLIMRLQVWE